MKTPKSPARKGKPPSNYVLFEGKKHSGALSDSSPKARLRNGIIMLNQSAASTISHASACEVLYDEANRVIALRPQNADVAHAFRTRTGSRGSGLRLKPLSFFKHFGIDTSVSTLCPAREEDGMLLIELP